jgi:glutamate N-acetyltransferase/amino-acid N-acetyltransferase
MFTILPIKGNFDQIDGIYCDGISAGLKPSNALDMGFIYSDTLCDIESIFTKNRFQAAPLKHYQLYPNDFKTNFILINAKNANAMTGKKGIEDINTIFNTIDSKDKIVNPIMSSTGVIGNPLPLEKLINGANNFDLKSKNGTNLSKAIMTTDSYTKHTMYEVILDAVSKFKI